MSKFLFKNFYKGILAGLSIGFGGFLYILMTYLLPNEFGKILGSILFAVGLFVVCTFYLSLYTGKIGMIYEEKHTKQFYWSLPVMLVGNAIGAFGLGYLCYAIFKNTDMMETVNNVCSIRTRLNSFEDYLSCMIKSFLCGLCVYIAVKAFSFNRLKPLGIGLLVFFVFFFVYCGFQHCIANMFYFGFANHMKWETLYDLLLCILFNSFGPIIGVLLFKAFSKGH